MWLQRGTLSKTFKTQFQQLDFAVHFIQSTVLLIWCTTQSFSWSKHIHTFNILSSLKMNMIFWTLNSQVYNRSAKLKPQVIKCEISDCTNVHICYLLQCHYQLSLEYLQQPLSNPVSYTPAVWKCTNIPQTLVMSFRVSLFGCITWTNLWEPQHSTMRFMTSLAWCR
jgi:hypothetical protein